MKRFVMLLVLLCLIVMLLAQPQSAEAAAAGSCTATSRSLGRFIVYTFEWTSSAGGAVTEVGPIVVTGKLVGVKFTPAASTDQPTDLYDVTMLNAGGADVLNGKGANLPNGQNSVNQWHTPKNPDADYIYLVDETITPAVANAGSAKKGTIQLFVE